MDVGAGLGVEVEAIIGRCVAVRVGVTCVTCGLHEIRIKRNAIGSQDRRNILPVFNSTLHTLFSRL